MGQSSSRVDSEGNPLLPTGSRKVYSKPYCQWITLMRTIIGCFVAIACWAAGIPSITENSAVWLGIYLVVIAIPITLLEFGYLINLVCRCHGGACCNIWHFLEWFSSFKRGILYILLAAAAWAIGGATQFNLWDVVACVGLSLLCLLYMLQPFQYRKEKVYTVTKPDETASKPGTSSASLTENSDGKKSGTSYDTIEKIP